MAIRSDLSGLLLKLLMSQGEAYIGLSTLQPAADEPTTIQAFSGTEPLGFVGYERQKVDLSAWKVVDGNAVGPVLQFRSGDQRPWPAIRSSFIATTDRGNGILLGWSLLRAPRLLMMNDRLELESSIRLDAEI